MGVRRILRRRRPRRPDQAHAGRAAVRPGEPPAHGHRDRDRHGDAAGPRLAAHAPRRRPPGRLRPARRGAGPGR
ncbi:hypothetical protein D5H75_35615 [Bailinhaonella thermotolerans]|uniref:Uncharacterized protein n=1 Tax=Bailinhaonella thermotolerans TaxID=1070861 RepID=A0A3A4ASU3_9ACTN|nr:hypothetical protein D5H75_35615 [Bailinhaonella thermotolerans]